MLMPPGDIRPVCIKEGCYTDVEEACLRYCANHSTLWYARETHRIGCARRYCADPREDDSTLCVRHIRERNRSRTTHEEPETVPTYTGTCVVAGCTAPPWVDLRYCVMHNTIAFFRSAGITSCSLWRCSTPRLPDDTMCAEHCHDRQQRDNTYSISQLELLVKRAKRSVTL